MTTTRTQESATPDDGSDDAGPDEPAGSDEPAGPDDTAGFEPAEPAPPRPGRGLARVRQAAHPRRLLQALTPARLLLLLVAAAAGLLYGWSIDSDSLEIYYASGVHSMASSRHDFFFDAFDPRGSVSLDKLPGAFWVQALSVRAFGYSVWAMVLPQVVEAVLTVLVLYRAVRRVAGSPAALIAAALLAVSPVVLTSTRSNLPEPLSATTRASA